MLSESNATKRRQNFHWTESRLKIPKATSSSKSKTRSIGVPQRSESLWHLCCNRQCWKTIPQHRMGQIPACRLFSYHMCGCFLKIYPNYTRTNAFYGISPQISLRERNTDFWHQTTGKHWKKSYNNQNNHPQSQISWFPIWNLWHTDSCVSIKDHFCGTFPQSVPTSSVWLHSSSS